MFNINNLFNIEFDNYVFECKNRYFDNEKYKEFMEFLKKVSFTYDTSINNFKIKFSEKKIEKSSVPEQINFQVYVSDMRDELELMLKMVKSNREIFENSLQGFLDDEQKEIFKNAQQNIDKSLSECKKNIS